MRVLVTADLHYRPSRRQTYVDFAHQVLASQPDCFVIAGDTGHPLRLFRRALQLFGDLECPKLLVAGNHDVYKGEHDSRTLWQVVLPQVTQEEGFVWLEQTSVTLPLQPTVNPHPVEPGALLGICGTMAWYDYSSRSPWLDYDHRELQAQKRLVNHDYDYVNWPWSDRTVARYLARGFKQRLVQLVTNPAVTQILVVSHVPPFAEALPDHPASEFWSLLRTYLGNFTLGAWLRQQPKVTHVVSGHVHRPGSWSVPGAHGPIDFQVVGSQWNSPRAVLLTF